MTSIIEYVTQNYIFILFFAIVILLAVIGYFAEKANNIQKEKNKEEKNEEKTEQNHQPISSEMRLDSRTGKPFIKEEINKPVMKFDPQTGKPLFQNEIRVEDAKEKNIKLNELNNNFNAVSNFEKQDVNNAIQHVQMNIENDMSISNDEGMNFNSQTGEPLNKNINVNENFDNSVVVNSNNLEEQTFNSNLNSDQQQSGEEKNVFNNNEFDKFSLEFDSLLPKKEIINTDLLSDIDSLELEKTQKIDLSGVPDLDNIELPKIKQMVEEDDIWNF